MEWKIGEIKQVNGEWFQCVRGQSEEKCTGCFFEASPICIDLNCLGNERKDHTKVIFKKLEKVGEPISFTKGLYFQRYHLYNSDPYYIGEKMLFFSSPIEEFVYIEIKQNKEDMEEKEWKTETIEQCSRGKRPTLNKKSELKLKPFNLEEAKVGKPVCTRDGRKARIICWDCLDESGNFPIIALISYTMPDGRIAEKYCNYTKNGRYSSSGMRNDEDLMMLPEKKEGWVNLYKVGARLETGGSVHSTKDAAIKCIDSDRKHIATVKVEYLD